MDYDGFFRFQYALSSFREPLRTFLLPRHSAFNGLPISAKPGRNKKLYKSQLSPVPFHKLHFSHSGFCPVSRISDYLTRSPKYTDKLYISVTQLQYPLSSLYNVILFKQGLTRNCNKTIVGLVICLIQCNINIL
jgi:hypothetical protein